MRIRIGPFKAACANLDGNSLCCGVPSPLAALGFADALARRAGGPPAPASKACLIVHSCQVSEGQIKPTPIHAGKGVIQNAEIPERVVGFVRVTLILKEFPDIDDGALRAALPGMRFCGAPIFTAHEAKLSVVSAIPKTGRAHDARHIPFSVLHDNEPGRLFGGLPRGYALIPRPDLAPPAFGAAEELDALSEHLAFFEEEVAAGLPAVDPGTGPDRAPHNAGHRPSRRRTSGWIVPVPVGYRALQDLASVAPRTGSRDAGVPHVFAEDAAALAEFVSIRSLARAVTPIPDPFWSWARDGARGLFLAHPDFLKHTAPSSPTKVQHARRG